MASSRAGEGKKKLHHLEVHPAKNGGHTVEHHYALDGGMLLHEPEVYAFADAKDALEHLTRHLNGAAATNNKESNSDAIHQATG